MVLIINTIMLITFACAECGNYKTKQLNRHLPAKYCSKNCKSSAQRRAKPVTREWLVEHYIDKRMDCTQIAKIVKRDSKRVWEWLQDFGIPTRPRGVDWKKNLSAGREPGFKHTEEFKKRLSEIAKAQGRVPFDPKVGPRNRGKKGPETNNWKGGATPERQAFYHSAEWVSAAKQVRKRDNMQCQHCGLTWSGSGMQFDIHHIVPFPYKPLRAAVDNLVLLCEKCHYWIHSNENTEKKFIKEIPDK